MDFDFSNEFSQSCSQRVWKYRLIIFLRFACGQFDGKYLNVLFFLNQNARTHGKVGCCYFQQGTREA